MKIEESINIDRSPEDVFAYLEVRSHAAAWMAAVVESGWLDRKEASDSATPVGVGRRGRMVLQFPGRRSAFIDEGIEYEPGRRIAHRTVEWSIPLITACICKPADGKCRATVVSEAHHLPGGVLGRLAEPMVTRGVRRGFRTDLTRLKDILESDAARRQP